MTVDQDLRPILMVDDDKDDQRLVEKALREKGAANPMLFLSDGEELLDYLKGKGKFSSSKAVGRPCFVLLDLNMPRMDGRKALLFLKADPELKKIPVLVLSTSNAEEDVLRSYNLGANSFIVKPIDYHGLLAMADSLVKYWLEVVELPPNNGKEPPP
ncbi:MAG TPA: response regulator [bacterium]|nr:response regulator [bacterium]